MLERISNFDRLLDLIKNCEVLVEIDLGQNGLSGKQLRQVIQAILSLCKRCIEVLHLDRNKPDPSIA